MSSPARKHNKPMRATRKRTRVINVVSRYEVLVDK